MQATRTTLRHSEHSKLKILGERSERQLAKRVVFPKRPEKTLHLLPRDLLDGCRLPLRLVVLVNEHRPNAFAEIALWLRPHAPLRHAVLCDECLSESDVAMPEQRLQCQLHGC